MSSPAIYRIRVRGKLDTHLVRHLDGLNLTEFSADGTAPDSILVGRFVDQAALSGLLKALYDFQLPLVAVDCLDAEPTADPDRSHSLGHG